MKNKWPKTLINHTAWGTQRKKKLPYDRSKKWKPHHHSINETALRNIKIHYKLHPKHPDVLVDGNNSTLIDSYDGIFKDAKYEEKKYVPMATRKHNMANKRD